MKRNCFTVVLLLVLSNIVGQNGTIKISKSAPSKNQVAIDSLNAIIDKAQTEVDSLETITNKDSIDEHHLFAFTTFSYEQKYFFSDLDKQFETIDNNGKIGRPCNYISVGIIDQFNVTRGAYSFPGYFTFSYLLPSRVKLYDSIKERLQGFNFKFSVAGQNVIDKNHIGIFFTEGINLGRLKIIDEKSEKVKNAIVAPYLGFVLRLTISRFTLFAVSQVDYDISSSHWKKTWVSKNQKDEIPNFKQSGLGFSIGINYSIDKIYMR